MIFKSRVIVQLLLFLAMDVAVHGQSSPVKQAEEGVPTKGYWVVVNNVKTPESSVVHFYTNDNVEFYSEKVEGIELDIKKINIRKKLNRILDRSMQVWAQTRSLQDQQLVRTALTNRNRW